MDEEAPTAVALPGGRRVWWTSVRGWASVAVIVTTLLVVGAVESMNAATGLIKALTVPLFAIAYVSWIGALVTFVRGLTIDELATKWESLTSWRRGAFMIVLAGLAIPFVA